MAELVLSGTDLEAKAAQSANRPALGSINLYAMRSTLTDLLAAIGRTPEFATYTKHDISHIDQMLRAADWIIPPATRENMSVADALVLTLSIYVHDLGMLVTEDEYVRRGESDFPAFAAAIMEDESDRGIDFRDRFNALDTEKRDHFLYEEFVRVHHAERIEAWINGTPHEKFGVSDNAALIVSDLLSPLEDVLRTDVAMVARSHHLSDLDDVSKYKINRAYSSDADDIANLQYVAVILRTVDLLHMTRDRTPMIQYQLASPSDPMGQREWQKQSPVRAVKAKVAAEAKVATCVEVHATFDKAEGFFALMEYLDYCEEQLKQSMVWISTSAGSFAEAVNYEFSWVEIDREQIEAKGFDRSQFTFSFDQQKVLELLTGHTLYNDAGVAIRELVQNSIDAVRLARERQLPHDVAQNEIEVTFDSASRTLTVLDRGVGMTQTDIERHFLKVGSSSYQTDEFKELFPNFTSISRFGIGVLSAFMIADEVRVATIADAAATGRELVLKSVHGRYLIKTFDRKDEYASRIGEHGTEIQLKLRASSGLVDDVLTLLRRWIVLPGCKVVCIEDGRSPIVIGSKSTKEALEALVANLSLKNEQTRVTEYVYGTTHVAIAQSWNPVYKEWDILRLGSRRELGVLARSEVKEPISGVSVQGVRVSREVPGFGEGGPLMLANVDGPSAPTTNVARTQLESGPQLEELTRQIYRAFLQSITEQIEEVSSRISVRLALSEASHIYSDATRSDLEALYTKQDLLVRVLREADVHPVEVDGHLKPSSSSSLESTGFSVLIGPAADDASRFLDWLPKPKGLLELLQEGGLLQEAGDDSRPLLGGRSALFAYDELLWNEFEPSRLKSLESGSSLFLDFESASGRWLSNDPFFRDLLPHLRAMREAVEVVRAERQIYGRSHRVRFAVPGVMAVEGLDSFDAFVVAGYVLFLPGSKIADLAKVLTDLHLNEPTEGTAGSLAVLQVIAEWSSSWHSSPETDKRFSEGLIAFLDETSRKSWPEASTLVTLASSVSAVNVWTSASAWQRRGDQT